MPTYLVTGGSGLVGKALQHIVEDSSEWIFLSSQDGDLRSLEECRKCLKHMPTHVIHLAAIVGGLFHNMSCGADFFDGNMRMALNVFRCAHGANVQHVVSVYLHVYFPTVYAVLVNLLKNTSTRRSSTSF